MASQVLPTPVRPQDVADFLRAMKVRGYVCVFVCVSACERANMASEITL